MSDVNPSEVTVQVDGEHETQSGWLYTMTITWDDGSTSDHELTMAWVDHEHLVGGAISPSVIAKVVARMAANHFGRVQMPPRCDVSSLRRVIPSFDQRLKSDPT